MVHDTISIQWGGSKARLLNKYLWDNQEFLEYKLKLLLHTTVSLSWNGNINVPEYNVGTCINLWGRSFETGH